MSTANALPTAAMIIAHDVADYATWKAAFDGHESARRAAGMLGHHINRGRDNPNSLSVYLSLGDVEKAKAFAMSPDLHAVMAKAGVTSAPQVTWMTPVFSHVVWDEGTPAMLVAHRVADFDKWLAGYHAVQPVRDAGGIVGHAVNRAIDDPNMVVVYHQAKTADALNAFASSPDLKAAMQNAGVISAPTFTFVTGGESKKY